MAWRGSLSRSVMATARSSTIRTSPPLPRLRPPPLAAPRLQSRRLSFANPRYSTKSPHCLSPGTWENWVAFNRFSRWSPDPASRRTWPSDCGLVASCLTVPSAALVRIANSLFGGMEKMGDARSFHSDQKAE